MTNPLENYVDVLEAARRLRIHPESARRLVRNGKLPGFKFANKWLIEAAALEQFAATYDPRSGAKPMLL